MSKGNIVLATGSDVPAASLYEYGCSHHCLLGFVVDEIGSTDATVCSSLMYQKTFDQVDFHWNPDLIFVKEVFLRP